MMFLAEAVCLFKMSHEGAGLADGEGIVLFPADDLSTFGPVDKFEAAFRLGGEGDFTAYLNFLALADGAFLWRLRTGGNEEEDWWWWRVGRVETICGTVVAYDEDLPQIVDTDCPVKEDSAVRRNEGVEVEHGARTVDDEGAFVVACQISCAHDVAGIVDGDGSAVFSA